MKRGRRKFTLEEKLQILREGENQGVDVTCRKFQISRSLFYSWKSKFDQQGPDGLAPQYHRVDPKIRALERENERLRKIISRQAIPGRILA
ncbi:transposase [Tenuifilum thalassicum]|uniref:Transposase n=1 Tax=Tenuifilum thalassicum TaxID=2590900 RepID=A0A7D4C1N7_9BACT|nr:transposase [Tenuifilum thalassicum]QKG80884.1 transposase [Tenuifilum thalassicum]